MRIIHHHTSLVFFYLGTFTNICAFANFFFVLEGTLWYMYTLNVHTSTFKLYLLRHGTKHNARQRVVLYSPETYFNLGSMLTGSLSMLEIPMKTYIQYSPCRFHASHPLISTSVQSMMLVMCMVLVINFHHSKALRSCRVLVNFSTVPHTRSMLSSPGHTKGDPWMLLRSIQEVIGRFEDTSLHF